MNTIKKIFSMVFAVMLIMTFSATAFAAGEGTPRLDKSGIMIGNISEVGQEALNGELPQWNPGDGPAPQVTQIELEDYGFLESNGHFCVILKVYGYGSDVTYFNGQQVNWFQQTPFVVYGTGADGFYYWYDCGNISQGNSYPFTSTFTSTNVPRTQRTFTTTFTYN